ncbi:hypothetical protein D3C71_1528090 [compost metagenome]
MCEAVVADVAKLLLGSHRIRDPIGRGDRSPKGDDNLISTFQNEAEGLPYIRNGFGPDNMLNRIRRRNYK